MKREIKHIHFQITRNCNLRCSFCGQWGKKGFFSDALGEEMTFSDWEKVISELEEIRKKTGISPLITVWGGEPLVSPIFDELMTLLKSKDFETEIITNGVFIDKHTEVINSCVGRLYVSVDGTREIHDAVRGKGVYDKVAKNIKELAHKNVTVMSVITDKLIKVLPEFLNELNGLNIKELFLQDMIGLTACEIKAYKEFVRKAFGVEARGIEAWLTDEKINFSEELEKRLLKCDLKSLNYRITHKKHTADKTVICNLPFSHPHIAWNGDVLYCTDFYDFTAGNVKEESLLNIFLNEKSEKFRQAVSENACSTCNHCSWRES